MSTHPLYPGQDGLSRIANSVISVLSEMPFVRRIALFGSLAESRADCWSDVDMQVACDNVESDRWVASAAIRSALPVLYYRKFTAVDPPAGRYWFAGESPFHKLDIGFVLLDEYEAWKVNPEYFGHRITLAEVYASDVAQAAADPVRPACFPGPATEYETEVGSYIYFSIRALKQRLRGECVQERDLVRIAKLRGLMPSIPRHITMSGGRIGELAHQVCGMLDHLQLGL